MSKDLLTLQEISERLNIPPSTCRYYAKTYSDYMPGVKTGRYMKYEPEAIEIIKVIAEGYSSNLQQQQIREQLQGKFALNIDNKENESTATTTAATKQQQTEISSYGESRAMFEYIIKEQAEIIRQQAAIIERLTRQLEPGKPARSWLQKLFRKGKH